MNFIQYSQASLLSFLILIALTQSIQCRQTCPFNDERNQIINQKNLFARRSLEESQMRFAASFEQIRIHSDFSNMNNNYQDANTLKKLQYLQTKIIPIAIKYYESLLKVHRIVGNLKVDPSDISDCLSLIDVPEEHQSTGVETDFLVYFRTEYNESADYVAYAGTCLLIKRPIIGIVNFNLYYLDTSELIFEENIDTTIHEMMHVFVFNNQYYSLYYDQDGNQRSYDDVVTTIVDQDYLTTPKVKAFVQEHFNCPSLIGARLEDDGGDGSKGAHWEKGDYHGEVIASHFKFLKIMTSEVQVRDDIISDLTLCLLEDSGWYEVDRTLAENFYWGKNQGCDFPLTLCNSPENFSEFCSASQGCTKTGIFKGSCIKSTFSDDCYFINPIAEVLSNCKFNIDGNIYLDEKKAEIYGEKSRCFMSNIYQGASQNYAEPVCYEATCENEQIIITVNGNTLVCSSDGQTLSCLLNSFVLLFEVTGDYVGQIICPNIEEYCMDNYKACDTFCSTNGYCINGECLCLDGYEGEDCAGWICFEYCDQCSNSSTCNKCKSGYYLASDSASCVTICPAKDLQQCLECVDFCEICLNATDCSQCQTGRTLSSNSGFCECDSGTYSVSTDNSCSSCSDAIPNCELCQNDAQCEQCSVGYQLNANQICEKEQEQEVQPDQKQQTEQGQELEQESTENLTDNETNTAHKLVLFELLFSFLLFISLNR